MFCKLKDKSEKDKVTHTHQGRYQFIFRQHNLYLIFYPDTPAPFAKVLHEYGAE